MWIAILNLYITGKYSEKRKKTNVNEKNTKTETNVS